MNLPRYAIAGCASILFHSFLATAMPEKKVAIAPVATATSVSVNLVTLPVTPATPVSQPVVTPSQPIVPPANTKPMKTTMKKLVNKATPEKKNKHQKPKVVQHSKKQPSQKKPVTKKIDKPIIKKTMAKTINKHAKPSTSQSMAPKATAKVKAPTAKTGSAPKLVSKPTFATRPSPVAYPRLAKRRGIEGSVLVEVLIAESGKQIKQKLVKSSGTNVLDEAALKAIKQWRFSPHIINGKAIAHRVQIPVRFKLD